LLLLDEVLQLLQLLLLLMQLLLLLLDEVVQVLQLLVLLAEVSVLLADLIAKLFIDLTQVQYGGVVDLDAIHHIDAEQEALRQKA